MKKSQEFELRKRVGNLDSVFGAVDFVFNDGPAKGVRAFHVKNGKGLDMIVAADRGLDIPFLSYKGVPMAFASKTGMRAPALYQEEGVRGFLKQFYAGMLTTCGITYAGAPCEVDGRKLGLHGIYDNTPAAHVAARTEYEGDDAVIALSGSVKEACVFSEHMRLSRKITVETERDVVRIDDTVENLGFDEQPAMLIYHINFGYPMLDEGAKLYFNHAKTQPRDEIARSGPGVYDVMDAPEVGRDEQCYFHTEAKEDEGFAMIHNEKLGMAAIVSYDAKAFPLMCEWKCMRAGDYALGLEPTVSGVMGRAVAGEEGMLRMLKPGEKAAFAVRLIYTDDEAVIASYKARAAK